MDWHDPVIWVAAALVFVVLHLVLRWLRQAGSEPAPSASPAIDEAFENNHRFVAGYALARLPRQPAKRLAVIACMDARIPVEAVVGISPGDAHVLRNAGGVVTDDVLRSLILSHHELNTCEVLILQHTDCALAHVKDDALEARLERITGEKPPAPVCFHGFKDLTVSVRAQMDKVRRHPWLARRLVVRGCIYDVKTGGITEIDTPPERL
jgi:carbonic anhydrase